MIPDFNELKNIFFIGVAGTGMSALAQYVKGSGIDTSGSDRYFQPDEQNEIKEKLEASGIKCFGQDGSGVTNETELVVVSTAIEDTVPEVIKAKQLNVPIIRRSELLAMITDTKKTIAIGGTSGKSTTCAMLFEIMEHAGFDPGIITGAGLISLIEKGKIGNAKNGKGEWLIIEADESDGSIVQYKPEIGVFLNLEKDHKETDELMMLFDEFKKNSKNFIVNLGHPKAAVLSSGKKNDFSANEEIQAGYHALSFKQNGFQIEFSVNGIHFSVTAIGIHNMENALAAIAVANQVGIGLEICAEALKNYKGIYRRHQVYGKKSGVLLIDDFAHNPVKCAASIKACQALAPKVIAWFQPHGYGPTSFLRNDFVNEIFSVLRTVDEIWMSEIFYAGGTAIKNISAEDLILDLKNRGAHAFFVPDRDDLLNAILAHLNDNCVLLLMGARDPSLEDFAKQVWNQL